MKTFGNLMSKATQRRFLPSAVTMVVATAALLAIIAYFSTAATLTGSLRNFQGESTHHRMLQMMPGLIGSGSSAGINTEDLLTDSDAMNDLIDSQQGTDMSDAQEGAANKGEGFADMVALFQFLLRMFQNK